MVLGETVAPLNERIIPAESFVMKCDSKDCQFELREFQPLTIYRRRDGQYEIGVNYQRRFIPEASTHVDFYPGHRNFSLTAVVNGVKINCLPLHLKR